MYLQNSTCTVLSSIIIINDTYSLINYCPLSYRSPTFKQLRPIHEALFSTRSLRIILFWILNRIKNNGGLISQYVKRRTEHVTGQMTSLTNKSVGVPLSSDWNSVVNWLLSQMSQLILIDLHLVGALPSFVDAAAYFSEERKKKLVCGESGKCQMQIGPTWCVEQN